MADKTGHDWLVHIAEGRYQEAINAGDPADIAKFRWVLDSAQRMREQAESTGEVLSDPSGAHFRLVLGYERHVEGRVLATTPAVWMPEPVDWDALRSDDFDDEPFLLEPLLVEGRAHALYAPAKTGKSLLILEAVVAIATGGHFLGQPSGEAFHVLYLDYEMTRADLRARLEAMGKLDADLSRLHYFLIPALDPLDTAAGGAQIEMLADRYKAKVIVIDTTARAIEGAENDADTIRALYRHSGARLKARGVTTLRVDHAGKDIDAGQRGSSAKNDDVDIVWQLTGVGDRLKLKCTHQRVGFLPQQVELQRTQQPLHHTIIEDTWPPGTEALAARLDQIGLAADAGRPAARVAINEHNDAHPNDPINAGARLIEAAIRWRKVAAQRTATASIVDMIGAA